MNDAIFRSKLREAFHTRMEKEYGGRLGVLEPIELPDGGFGLYKGISAYNKKGDAVEINVLYKPSSADRAAKKIPEEFKFWDKVYRVKFVQV